MDPKQFNQLRKIFEDRGMQEWARNLQRPETQRWMKDLQSSGMREWFKTLQQPKMQEHLLNLQRPEMQGFLKYLQRPETQRRMKDLWGLQDVMKRKWPITGHRLPPAVFSPSINVNQGLARAAAEAAKSAQAAQLRSATENLAKSFSVNLPTEALASAQYSALRHAMGTPAWTSALRELTRSPFNEAQARYAETMRDATRLLSDETIRRLMELAESAELIEEGIDTAEETDSPLEDVVTEETEYMGLDVSTAVDMLLPILQWSIVVLSVAWIMASTNPMYKEYKEPLTKTLTELYVVERVLKWHKEHTQANKDE